MIGFVVGQLISANFESHSDIQSATMNVIDNTHQSTEHFISNWIRTDEWYNFRDINSRPLLDWSCYQYANIFFDAFKVFC